MKKVMIGLMCLIVSSLSFCKWDGKNLTDRFGNPDKSYYGALGYEKGETHLPTICVYSTGMTRIFSHDLVGRLPDANSSVTDVEFLFPNGTKINCLGTYDMNEVYLLERFYPETYKEILDNIKSSNSMKISIRKLLGGYTVLEIDNKASALHINKVIELSN